MPSDLYHVVHRIVEAQIHMITIWLGVGARGIEKIIDAYFNIFCTCALKGAA